MSSFTDTTAAPPRKVHLPSILMGIGLLLPPLLYVSLLASRANNIPWNDDLTSVLPFLVGWSEAEGWIEHLNLITAQHHSHRIVATKLVALAIHALPGNFNFIWMHVIGWAGWIAICFGIIQSSVRLHRCLIAVLPIPLLLMQPQGFSNLTVGMQGVQNIGVVLFALIACRMASREGRTASLCLPLIFVAPFISTNGLLLGPILLVQSLLLGRKRLMGAIAGVGIVTTVSFFITYQSDLTAFSLTELITNASVMLGSGYAPLRLDQHAGMIGLIAGLGFSALLFRRALWRESPDLMGFLLFTLGSIGMAAYGRIGWGADYMLQDRYKLYGLIAGAITMALLLPRLSPLLRRWTSIAAVGGCLGFSIISYLDSWPLLRNVDQWTRMTAANRQLNHWFPKISDIGWTRAVENLQRAEQSGIYHLPAVLTPIQVKFIQELKASELQPTARLEQIPDASLCGYRLEPADAELRNLQPEFGLLLSAHGRVLLPVTRPRARISEFLRKGSLSSPLYGLVLPSSVATHPLDNVLLIREETLNSLQVLAITNRHP